MMIFSVRLGSCSMLSIEILLNDFRIISFGQGKYE
ncbi:Uncharacterised protein [Yersinia aldovae]|uniref:Uncharacterized protein n=1 Tax=Yersinia aldovae TaxID=29483 RepID=A0A0T9TTL9_YERAL|nr:Uncharacterised protein [Yersinia aldovae]CNL01631.1 Uncharacterised protein [Yersinia aldovae]CNL23253.1 Uncharacterised protein [Yersinia aldovae]